MVCNASLSGAVELKQSMHVMQMIGTQAALSCNERHRAACSSELPPPACCLMLTDSMYSKYGNDQA